MAQTNTKIGENSENKIIKKRAKNASPSTIAKILKEYGTMPNHELAKKHGFSSSAIKKWRLKAVNSGANLKGYGKVGFSWSGLAKDLNAHLNEKII